MISIFKDINQFARKWKTLDGFAIFCARILPYLMVVFLFFYSVYISNVYLFIFAILSGLFARFIVNELVHLFYKEIRPARLEGTKVLIPVPQNYSFPSGHSSFFFGVSCFLIFYNTYLAIIFILLSFLIGIARVFCGVHWFRDILGGFVAGLLSAIIIYYSLAIIIR
jgi:undecaprenyl-diphosphatase